MTTIITNCHQRFNVEHKTTKQSRAENLPPTPSVVAKQVFDPSTFLFNLLWVAFIVSQSLQSWSQGYKQILG